MRFSILGPLQITDDDGVPVRLTRRLHRSACAFLLLSSGRPVLAADLIDALWGEAPPRRPVVSLRSCVYGLRQALQRPSLIRTHQAGYLIQAGPGELDVTEFRDLARAGRDQLDRGCMRQAADLLGNAAGLWREPALADLPAVTERDRLIALYAQVEDALVDARLALGAHQELLADLRARVGADPLREHAWAQLMLALYRCGARAAALAAFGEVRVALVEAYGIGPGPELQELHSQILADDPALRQPAGPVVLASQDRWVPACQLPAPVADFTGYPAELGTVLGRLSGDGMAVTVLSGMPGAGKTTLATYAAHLVAARFPDGQLLARLDDHDHGHDHDHDHDHDHGHDHGRDPQDVLAEVLRGLGVPADAIPAPGCEREARYRSVLAGRRVLVLADGAASAAQVRPLLPGSAGSAALVTSRGRLPDLDGARAIELCGLSPDASESLLAAVSGRMLSGADAIAARVAAACCGHLPMALRIAGARLAAEPGLTMPALAALLGDPASCLDELAVGETSVRARLACAAATAGPAARHALTLLALAGQRAIPGWLAVALLGERDARRQVPALVSSGLAGPVGSGDGRPPGCLLHPLVLAYARELLAALDPAVTRAATDRLVTSGWLELAGRGAGGRLRPVP